MTVNGYVNDDELRATLGDDLYELVRSGRLQVVSVGRISPLRSPGWSRAAFRLNLADGSSVKGRRLESAAAAERAARLATCLPQGMFPRIVAQRGTALISEWVEGSVLCSSAIRGDHLRRAGAIQRSIHEIALPEHSSAAPDRYPGGSWRQRLESRLERLCRTGALESREAGQTMDIAEVHLPDSVLVTLVHGDVCPENIVIDSTGNLHIVDNEGIDLHAPEFDLARTWYRWRMTPDERRVFEEGYAARDVLASYHRHFPHWAAVVLVGASEFRLRYGLDASDAIRCLREVLGHDAARSAMSPAR